MTLADYISQYRSTHGLSQRKLAEQCGLSNGYISMLERGINPNTNKPIVPSLVQLQKLADGMNTTTMQMLEEVEDMPIDISQLSDAGASRKKIPLGYSPMPETESVPRVGRIACGDPITAEENIETHDEVLSSWHADFTLMCVGDSMAPKIEDGDVVAIRAQQTIENGEIAAVRIGDEATLKKVYIHHDYIELRPINPAFESIIRRKEEMDDIRIEGKAVGLCRNL